MSETNQHTAVSALIQVEDRYCFLFHRKNAYLHLPGGKSKPEETWEQTLRRELKEELDIDLAARQTYHLIYDEPRYFPNKEYPSGSGNYIDIRQCYVLMTGYRREMKNLEPNKHAGILWLTKEELIDSGCNYSFVIKDMLDSGIIK